MSKVIDAAVQALAAKAGDSFDATAKFVFVGEGSIMFDANGAREGDGDADVTLTAATEVFQAMLAGDLSATTAFMTGKLTVDGSMGLAMKLGQVLS